MGQAKKDLEKQENEALHAGENCERCGSELTQSDVEYINQFGGRKLCADCRLEWDKIQKD